jgi:hypothetical protein
MDGFRADRDAADRLDRSRGAFPAYEEPNRLPDPIPDLGYAYQWICTVLGGQPALENVDMMFRAGWEPVKQDEQPHILMLTEGRSAWVRNGCIEIGGLLLCKKPEEKVAQKLRHYDNLVEGRLNSFRDAVFAMSRREMPVEGEWKSFTTTGTDLKSR